MAAGAGEGAVWDGIRNWRRGSTVWDSCRNWRRGRKDGIRNRRRGSMGWQQEPEKRQYGMAAGTKEEVVWDGSRNQ
jgi:hypothetical protein